MSVKHYSLLLYCLITSCRANEAVQTAQLRLAFLQHRNQQCLQLQEQILTTAKQNLHYNELIKGYFKDIHQQHLDFIALCKKQELPPTPSKALSLMGQLISIFNFFNHIFCGTQPQQFPHDK